MKACTIQQNLVHFLGSLCINEGDIYKLSTPTVLKYSQLSDKRCILLSSDRSDCVGLESWLC